MPETPSKREWVIEPIILEDRVIPLSDVLAEQLARLSIVLQDIGGVLAVGTDRVQLEDGSYQTIRAVIRWESFSPARRAPKPQPEPEPEIDDEDENLVAEVEPEPEPVAAG